MIIKEKTEIEDYPDQERIKGGNLKMSHTDSPRSSDQGLITYQNKLTVNDTLKYDKKWLNTLTKVPKRKLFTGHNMFQWSSYIIRLLTTRNLMNHLTEDSPKIENPNYMEWIGSENILHGWLLDLMIHDIANLLKFEPSCKLIWEVVMESEVDNFLKF